MGKLQSGAPADRAGARQREGASRQGVPPQNIAIIPNGCDNNISARPRRGARDGTVPDDFVAIFAGTHGKANGLDAVLDAAVELRNRAGRTSSFCLSWRGKFNRPGGTRRPRTSMTNVVFLDSQNKERSPPPRRRGCGLQILENIRRFIMGPRRTSSSITRPRGLPVSPTIRVGLRTDHREPSRRCAVPPEDPRSFAMRWRRRRQPQRMGRRAPHIRALAETLFRALIRSGNDFVDWLEAAAGRPGKAMNTLLKSLGGGLNTLRAFCATGDALVICLFGFFILVFSDRQRPPKPSPGSHNLCKLRLWRARRAVLRPSVAW